MHQSRAFDVYVDNIVSRGHIRKHNTRPIQGRQSSTEKRCIMKMTGNTVLITGGTSGIGLELAQQLTTLGNTVILTGRDQAKLDRVRSEYPSLHTMQSDVTDPAAISALFERVTQEFPALNILINNAGIMRKINLQDRGADLEDLSREIETNLIGPVRMVKQFLPHLKSRPASAIVNVSSGLAFVPFPISPVYGATKAGLHSFTQSLRVQLKNTSVKVFELAPPSTQTPLQNAFDPTDVKASANMDVKTLAHKAIAGFKSDRLEIRPGLSNVLKLMSRIAPGLMLKATSGPVDAMLAQTERA